MDFTSLLPVKSAMNLFITKAKFIANKKQGYLQAKQSAKYLKDDK